MNNFTGNNFTGGSAGWQPSYQRYNNYGTPNINTNIIRVTSLEEAIMRTSERGSDMMYIHQDKDILYRVKVDFDGKKSWGEFPILVPNQDDTLPITKAEFTEVLNRLSVLEAKFNKSEVTENAE